MGSSGSSGNKSHDYRLFSADADYRDKGECDLLVFIYLLRKHTDDFCIAIDDKLPTTLLTFKSSVMKSSE